MTSLMRKLAWLAYATVYLLFTIRHNLEIYGFDSSSLLLVMNTVIPVALAFAIYGYSIDKAFMERMIWRVLFWILLLRLFFVAYINIKLGVVDDLWTLFLLLLPVPGLYVLYRYSELDNPVWTQREHREHEKFANELFSGKDTVVGRLDGEEGEGIACEASLTRRNEGFELQLRVSERGETREERHSFTSAIQALEYIEENTPLSMYELE